MSSREKPIPRRPDVLKAHLSKAARRLDRAKDRPVDDVIRGQAYLAYLKALRAYEQAIWSEG